MNTLTIERTATETTTSDIPFGFCHCGCGEKTRIAPWTDRNKGWGNGQPIRFINGHNRRGISPSVTISKERAAQMELDFALDDARLDRKNWQRAVENDLRALRDYVHPDSQYIVWRPSGLMGGKSQEVHLTNATSCTCSRFKLRDRCEHIEFVKQLEASGIVPGTDVPVSARSIEQREEQVA